jgi:chitin disaccharide deacetylase
MVGGSAAEDAIRRARGLPRLRVGLHIVLVEGRPVLVDASGCFRSDMAALGLDIFACPSVRRQVAAEIEAQFEAYRATGLALDHVDAHKHFHLHPTIAGLTMAIGRRYGLRALRVPREPASVLAEVDSSATLRRDYLTAPWVSLLGRRAKRAGLRIADAVFGLAWSGAMTQARLSGLLGRLPEGCTEIYLHPATANHFAGHAPGYRYADELAALVAPSALAAARRPDVRLGGYSDF